MKDFARVPTGNQATRLKLVRGETTPAVLLAGAERKP